MYVGIILPSLNYLECSSIILQIYLEYLFGIKSSISQFKEFFENNLSEITNEKLIFIYKEIIPIIFQNKNNYEIKELNTYNIAISHQENTLNNVNVA